MKISTKTVCKTILFLTYHLFVFGLLWYLVFSVFSLDTNKIWITGFNWIKPALNTFLAAVYTVSVVISIFSCFSKKKLTETQIGHWTWGGWIPEWGKNERNAWYGIFTGLPAPLVTIKAFDGTTKTEKVKKEIQAEIFGDPSRKKFAIEFDMNASWKIVDTYIWIKNPNKVEDLWNIATTSLTDWMNSPAHNYIDVLQVKHEKADIVVWVSEDLTQTICRYGVQMSDFKIVDIEMPSKAVDQQKTDEAARIAQLRADEREKLDTEAQIEQTNRILEEARKNGSTMSWDDAYDRALVLRGKIQKTQISTGGKGKKGGGNVVPVIHTGTGGHTGP